jgi:transcriptional regulator with GAF, ATPase, and Fis domain
MNRMMGEIEQVARTDATVLILGETGTGKELVARAIHAAGPRRQRPFITVNCGALPDTLIESELFGHERGAFTGATQRRDGRFALADGGTIFLDEIGELPLPLQVKLLRVLQEGEFERVGSSRTTKVDARVIAATNRDLRRAVESGEFRGDLYFRIHVFPIHVPPLRERGDDVVLLAEAFARRCGRRIGRRIEPFSGDAVRSLKAYDWPGNVRELQNVVERAVITSRDGRLILSRALPESARPPGEESPPIIASLATPDAEAPAVLTDSDVRNLERRNILLALESAGWRVSGPRGAARLLEISPSTLASRMKALGIRRSPGS